MSGGGGLLNLSSIGNYNFLYVIEPSIISSQFSRLYVCNLLEIYDGGKWSIFEKNKLPGLVKTTLL